MDTYEVHLTSFIARLVRDRERVKDIYQDVFLQVLQGIDKFEGRNNSSLWSWICRIAYYRFLDERKRTAHPGSAVAVGDLNVLDDLCRPSDSMRDDDRVAVRRALEQCLATITETMRARVMMRFYLGLTHAEIGEATGTEPGAVQVSISRLQRWLRKCLRAKEGHEERT